MLPTATNTSAANLAAYAGQKITIKWTGTETDKGRGTTDFLIDTTALNVSSSGSGVIHVEHGGHAHLGSSSASDSFVSAVDPKVPGLHWLGVLFLGMRGIF